MLVGYDSVDISAIPKNPQVVMCYDDGKFRNVDMARRLFPHAHVLRIAVFAKDDGDVLDVERGDASPGEAPGWFERQAHNGVWRPCIYMSRSVMPEVQKAMEDFHIPRAEYRLWSASYDTDASGHHFPHIDPGADGTQWTDNALGRNLDESLLLPTFIRHDPPALHRTYRAIVEIDPFGLKWDIAPAPFGKRVN